MSQPITPPAANGAALRLREVGRRRRLTANERIGAHSKREIRRVERDLYARLWPKLLEPAAVVGLGLVVLHWTLPDVVAPYVTTAFATAVLCQMRQLGLDASGMTSRRLGIMAEQWTADELRRLDHRTWDVVHHVMLEQSDIDHVAVGPAGVVAVETKFRSSWAHTDLHSVAFDAARQRRKLAARSHQEASNVRCLVAMWGPDVGDDPLDIHGVVLCPGRSLAAWLRAADQRLNDTQRASAVDALDAYVTTRDVGELREHGAVPTSLGAMVSQAGWIVATVVGTAYVIALAGSLPLPVASILFITGVISAPALWWRRSGASGFARRLTTAVLATSLGLGALLIGFVTLDLLMR